MPAAAAGEVRSLGNESGHCLLMSRLDNAVSDDAGGAGMTCHATSDLRANGQRSCCQQKAMAAFRKPAILNAMAAARYVRHPHAASTQNDRTPTGSTGFKTVRTNAMMAVADAMRRR